MQHVHMSREPDGMPVVLPTSQWGSSPPHRATSGMQAIFAASLVAIGLFVGVCLSSPASADEVWRAGSVLTIERSVTVSTSLTIESGVTAYFAASTGIVVESGATLTVVGTSSEPVRLLRLDHDAAWSGIRFVSGSSGILRHAEIFGASSTTVFIEGASPLIEHCRLGHADGSDGVPGHFAIIITGAGASPTIRHCMIESLHGYSRPAANNGVAGSNGPNGANGTIFSKNGKPGELGTNGTAGANGVAGGQAMAIVVQDGAGATIESNIIRWIVGGDGGAGGHGGDAGDGGAGGGGFDSNFAGDGGLGGNAGLPGSGGFGGLGGAAIGILVSELASSDLVIAGNATYAVTAGRGGGSGAGGAGGSGGAGGAGGSSSFGFGGDGGIGGEGTSGGNGGAAGSAGLTRAIGVQFPGAASTVSVVNNSLATIVGPSPAAGGAGGAAGPGGAGGPGGEGGFGADGVDGAEGSSGVAGISSEPGPTPTVIGVSAFGAGLIVETHNHAANLDPDGLFDAGAVAQFRAEGGAAMNVSHSCFTGHSVTAIGAVVLQQAVLDSDPLMVAVPFAIPSLSDCCVWEDGQTGCSSAICEATVCGKDPTCCASQWDAYCAALAEELCPSVCDPFASADLRLDTASPAIDLANNAMVPALLRTDLAGAPRITDGDGNGQAVVDAGAYESPAITCGADLTCDGTVDGADLAFLLGAWGPCPAPCTADLDGSGAVDAADLAILLGSWR